ncbi:hypothetical protein [Lentzea guizhouensis]|uniref:hypothetical protein n=1 Tax=Lentzea guizhouensis TaxID=1586287 RepID=UPI0012B684FF|nr:hypothetical protein [Lentzea guizhouensis]
MSNTTGPTADTVVVADAVTVSAGRGGGATRRMSTGRSGGVASRAVTRAAPSIATAAVK